MVVAAAGRKTCASGEPSSGSGCWAAWPSTSAPNFRAVGGSLIVRISMSQAHASAHAHTLAHARQRPPKREIKEDEAPRPPSTHCGRLAGRPADNGLPEAAYSKYTPLATNNETQTYALYLFFVTGCNGQHACVGRACCHPPRWVTSACYVCTLHRCVER